VTAVIRFPLRRLGTILICRERGGGWLVLHGSNGWLHGDRDGARADAAWLARNLSLPVQELRP
jgi:hypothetical protein